MLYIYCEGNEQGHTEAQFVSKILNPYLTQQGLNPAIAIPSRGLGPFKRTQENIQNLLRNPKARVTTLIDYYGMPTDFPGMPHHPLPPGNRGAVYTEVARLEAELGQALDNHKRFIPHYMLHEIETLTFVSPAAVEEQHRPASTNSILAKVAQMVTTSGGNPEWVNDSFATSPSHRLQGLWPNGRYKKTTDTIGIIARIPFVELRTNCRHFDQWIGRLLG